MSWPITLATAALLPSDVTTISLFQRYWLSDLKVMATAYGDHWEYSEIPSRTWANILAISSTSLKAGMTCKASDLSLHTFIWGGTYWQSLNGALIKVGSSRTSVTTSTVGDTTLYTPTVPANLLGSGGKVFAEFELVSLATANIKKVSIRTSAASQIAAIRWGSTSALGVKSKLVAQMNGKSAFYGFTNTGTLGEPWFSDSAAVAFDSTVSNTLSLVLSLSAAEATTVYGYDIYVERRAA